MRKLCVKPWILAHPIWLYILKKKSKNTTKYHNCACQKWGYWAEPQLGSQFNYEVGLGFPTLGRSQPRDPT